MRNKYVTNMFCGTHENIHCLPFLLHVILFIICKELPSNLKKKKKRRYPKQNYFSDVKSSVSSQIYANDQPEGL